jgi:hypothetical protein
VLFLLAIAAQLTARSPVLHQRDVGTEKSADQGRAQSRLHRLGPAVRPIVVKTQATTLYPFVPSGPDFALALRFFAALGFEKTYGKGLDFVASTTSDRRIVFINAGSR